MKPLHSALYRLTRCPCCLGKYSKHVSGNKSKSGKKAARAKLKKQTLNMICE